MKTAADYLPPEVTGPARGQYVVPKDPTPEAIRAPTAAEDAAKYLPPEEEAPPPDNRSFLDRAADFVRGPKDRSLLEQAGDSFTNAFKQGNAAARGAAESATLGAAPAIGGALNAGAKLLTGDTNVVDNYRAGRDEYKRQDAAAAAEAPVSTAAGSAGGALLTGPLGTARTALGRVGLGAGEAALTALNSGDADLTKGEFGKAAKETLAGGAVGLGLGVAAHGATAGAEALAKTKAVQWAEERLAKLRRSDLLKGLSKPETLKVLGAEGENTQRIDAALKADPGLADIAGASPQKALAGVRRTLESATQDLDKVYEKASELTPGVHFGDLRRNLQSFKSELGRNTATEGQAAEVQKILDSFTDKYATRKLPASGLTVEGRVPLQRVREEYRKWQDIAYKARKATGPLTAQQEVAEGVANALRDGLHDEIEKAAAAVPGSGPLRDLLRAENAKVETLKRVEGALVQRTANDTAKGARGPIEQAAREAAIPLSLAAGAAAISGDDDRLQNSLSIGLGSLALKKGAPALAKGLQDYAARKITGAEAAQVMRAAQRAIQTGASKAEVLSQAASQGLPEGLLRALQTIPSPSRSDAGTVQ